MVIFLKTANNSKVGVKTNRVLRATTQSAVLRHYSFKELNEFMLRGVIDTHFNRKFYPLIMFL